MMLGSLSRRSVLYMARCFALAVTLIRLDAAPASAQLICTINAQDETTVATSTSQVARPPTELRRRLSELLAERERTNSGETRAQIACLLAEISKRLGDGRADQFYRQAIELEPSNPEYRLLYGDYLRNYRGPGRPLVGAAATQYYAGLGANSPEVTNRIRRSLIALYERDGFSLGERIDQRRPRFFFSTQNTGAQSPDDPGSMDSMRLRASAALLAESRERLGRRLTATEFEAFIRNNWRGQTLQRFRARVGSTAVDAYFEGHMARASQPISFREPASTVDTSIGLGLEHVMNLYPAFDLLVRADVKWGSRKGLVEFQPSADETTRLTVAQAVASRFIGPDKINFEATIAHDSITPHVVNPEDRGVDVFGVTARYQIFRPLLGSQPYERPIASRGSEVFAGTARYTEAFGTVDVDRTDLFVGVALKGLPGGGTHSFDVTIQPTLFTFDRVSQAPDATRINPLANEQLETFVTVLYRLADRENEPDVQALPSMLFLNVVGLFSTGHARVGPAEFDRTRFGAQVDAKLVGRQRGGMTWLLSGRYELQHFAVLDRKEHVFGGSLSLGF